MPKYIPLFMVVLVSMVVFAACQPNASSTVENGHQQSDPAPQGQTEADVGVATVAEVPTMTPTLAVQEVDPTATNTPTEIPQLVDESLLEEPEQAAPAEAAAPGPPNHGNQLVATDPTTISLASGDVQLVEMFAFW
jgi:hypothetical protein